MRLYSIVLVFLLLCKFSASAAEYGDCESECELPYSCQTLLECRVAKMRCLDSCRHREAWIKLTQAVEKFTVSLAKQFEQLSVKFDSLREDLAAQNDQHNRQFTELYNKVQVLQEYLKPPIVEEPTTQEPAKK